MLDTQKKISVLVVDDSTVMRKILATALGKDPQIEVVGFAGNGAEAIEAVKNLSPEVVTLDIEMPVMDGITALKEIRKFEPRIPIIMFSTLTQSGARAAIDALMNGASDYVGKPAASLGMEEAFTVLSQTVIPKIKGLARRSQNSNRISNVNRDSRIKDTEALRLIPTQTTISLSALRAKGTRVEAVCIGVSTGGPVALVNLFEGLNSPVSFPIFIVQHMPPMFTAILAQRLNTIGKLRVSEARHEEEVQSGHVYIAPGGFHMSLKKTPSGKIVITLEDTPPENSCKPAVDVLFRAVARVYGANSLSIILTGMGQDGLKGAQEIKSAGGMVCVQDQESSVVWGMPGAIVQANFQNKVLPLSQIAHEIMRHSLPVTLSN